jgi:hypothetical protein
LYYSYLTGKNENNYETISLDRLLLFPSFKAGTPEYMEKNYIGDHNVRLVYVPNIADNNNNLIQTLNALFIYALTQQPGGQSQNRH